MSGVFEPVGWRCKTPHGYVIGKTQHASSDEAVYSQEAIDTLRAQLEAAERAAQALANTLTNVSARAEAAEANAARWLSWRALDEHTAADIAWTSGDANCRDAAIDAAMSRTKEQQA